jgi:hypothetical protein
MAGGFGDPRGICSRCAELEDIRTSRLPSYWRLTVPGLGPHEAAVIATSVRYIEKLMALCPHRDIDDCRDCPDYRPPGHPEECAYHQVARRYVRVPSRMPAYLKKATEAAGA